MMEQIKQLIADNQTDEAIRLLHQRLAERPDIDEAWYLLGRAHYKRGETRQALNAYLRAMEINPESPAREAYNMAIRVLDFYNKDMYNQ